MIDPEQWLTWLTTLPAGDPRLEVVWDYTVEHLPELIRPKAGLRVIALPSAMADQVMKHDSASRRTAFWEVHVYVDAPAQLSQRLRLAWPSVDECLAALAATAANTSA